MSTAPMAAGEPAQPVVVGGSRGFQIGDYNQQVNVDADPATLPPARIVSNGTVVHNLPPVSAVFEGRDLAELAGLLHGSGTGVVLGQAAVHGLGGVGKSEFANQYARAYLSRYQLVWWITADSPDNLILGLAALTSSLHPAATLVADRQAWALGWLQAHQGWLLVLDNVEDLADIAELLGQVGGQGQVVVTTRRDPGRADWRRAGLQPIRLGVLDRPASVRLLLELTGSQDANGADRLADDLGDLPLALEQAAGYLSQNPIAFDAYRSLLAHRFAQMAELGSEGGTTQRRVAGVWQQSMKLVVGRSPLAGRIMAVLACLAADELPEEVLAPLTDGDEADLGHALALLASYSMINRTGGAVSMHRLVQAVTTAYSPTPQSEQESFRGQATRLLNKAIPEDPVTNVTGWPRWNNLLPHIDALLNNLGPDHTDTIAMHLGDRAAMFRQHQGQLSPAITLFEQILADRRRVLGDDHPDTLSSLHHLASGYRSAGRLAEAIMLFEQVLTHRRRVLGNDHPETLNSRHNLAYTYLATGNPVEAITLLEHVLTDRRRVLGDDHPNTLISRDNLAGAYRSTGRLAEAIALLEQTVIDSRQVLGDDHPDTLISRRNLASAYVPAMRLPEAIALSEQVVIDSCRILGDDHPNTLIARKTLADAYQSAGRLAEAITLLEQTLTDSQQALGGDHPDTQAVASLLHRLRWNPDRSSTQ